MEKFRPKYFSRSCGACNGTGGLKYPTEEQCFYCHGDGKVSVEPDWEENVIATDTTFKTR